MLRVYRWVARSERKVAHSEDQLEKLLEELGKILPENLRNKEEKFKEQYIIEGCNLNNNFKIIIKKDHLFDEEKIEYQITPKNEKTKLLSFFDLTNLYGIKFKTSFKIYQILNDI